MVYHGVLLRDGFRRAEGGLNLQRLPSEQELAPKRTKSTEQADVTVVGESLTGQVLASEKYEQMRLDQVGRGLVRACCWPGSAGRHSGLPVHARRGPVDDMCVACVPRPGAEGASNQY
jgi:hypothetical protein